jgi:protein subunit release factor B
MAPAAIRSGRTKLVNRVAAMGKTVKQLKAEEKRKSSKIRNLEKALNKEKGLLNAIKRALPAAKKAEAAKKKKPAAKKK